MLRTGRCDRNTVRCGELAVLDWLEIAGSVAGQELTHNGPDTLVRSRPFGQHPRSEALSFADQAEQDVFCPDVVVSKRLRFPQRKLEHLLGATCEGDLADRWAARPSSTSAAGGNGLFERTFSEDFFGPTANFVEVDAKDTKRLRVCLVGRA